MLSLKLGWPLIAVQALKLVGPLQWLTMPRVPVSSIGICLL